MGSENLFTVGTYTIGANSTTGTTTVPFGSFGARSCGIPYGTNERFTDGTEGRPSARQPADVRPDACLAPDISDRLRRQWAGSFCGTSAERCAFAGFCIRGRVRNAEASRRNHMAHHVRVPLRNGCSPRVRFAVCETNQGGHCSTICSSMLNTTLALHSSLCSPQTSDALHLQARWFALHVIANAWIAILCVPDLLYMISNPIEALTQTSVNHWPTSLVFSVLLRSMSTNARANADFMEYISEVSMPEICTCMGVGCTSMDTRPNHVHHVHWKPNLKILSCVKSCPAAHPLFGIQPSAPQFRVCSLAQCQKVRRGLPLQ